MMKKILTIIFLFLTFISCNRDQRDLQTFNQFLGPEKSQALDLGIDFFNEFLIQNFPEETNQGLQMEAFLKRLMEDPDHIGPDSNWVFNSKRNQKILQYLDSTGMRQEIRLYGYEEYDLGTDSSQYVPPIILDTEEEELFPVAEQDSLKFEYPQNRLDSALWFNVQGKYLQGLKLIQNRDERIRNYIEAIETVGGTAFSIAIVGALKEYEPEDYEDPFIQRIIFAEIFWHVMQWELERNQIKTGRKNPNK